MGIKRFKEIILKHKRELERRYKINEIGLFGSYVNGKQKTGSDLDVLVEFSDPPGLFGFMELEDYLSKLLKIKIDLVRKKALKPLIGRQILKEVQYL